MRGGVLVKPAIRVENAQAIKEMLKLTGKEGRNVMRTAIHATAGEGRNMMKRLAPDHPDTKKGDIKRSIRTKRERMKWGVVRSTIRIATQKQSGRSRGFPYWLLQEYGNVNRQGVGPNVFVRPTYDWLMANLDPLLRKYFGIKWQARITRLAKKASK